MITRKEKIASLHRILFLTLLFLLWVGQSIRAQPYRLLVLTDIEADPDDTQSMIRLLLYSNEIDVEGLIATTSVHQKQKVVPETLLKLIEAYAKVRPNLILHEEGYPMADELKGMVKAGLPVYGLQGVGEGKDSEGSEWIIRMLQKNDERPLHISVWGGSNTLAQALYKIRASKSRGEAVRLISKLRVYTISDQDDSAAWIRREFPELWYVVSPGGYFNATWLGINTPVEGLDNTTISNGWLATNIQQFHGPLGAQYPDVAYGMEGDTPAFLSLIPNGLNNPEYPNWGGWGGRYERYLPENIPRGFTGGVPIEEETRPIWTNAKDQYQPYIPKPFGRAIEQDTVTFFDQKVTLWRWRDDFQNDFAARMDWCVKNYKEANHPPVPALGHSDQLTVRSGQFFDLSAKGTTDPDGDSLSYLWFQYLEAGTYQKKFSFNLAENLYVISSIKAPKVTQPETAHFILKVTDKGSPPLSRYKRVIVTLIPE